MKKIIYLFIIIGAIVLFITQGDKLRANISYIFQSPCDRPVEYKIGQIDSQFNISQNDFKQDVAEAANIWNAARNKQLIMFQPNAVLTVNLIYDERQSSLDRITQIKDTLNEGKSTFDAQKKQYESLESDFKTRLNEFNDQVNYWNSQGGAPAAQYEQLQKEQQDLKNEASQLNSLAQKLNLDARKYNIQVGQLNQSVETYNQNLQNKPEEGIYTADGTRIDIYVNNSRDELIHTLTHELGHALGVEHVTDDKNAIMYPYTSSTLTLTNGDKVGLNNVCQYGSAYETTKTRISDFWKTLINGFSYTISQ